MIQGDLRPFKHDAGPFKWSRLRWRMLTFKMSLCIGDISGEWRCKFMIVNGDVGRAAYHDNKKISLLTAHEATLHPGRGYRVFGSSEEKDPRENRQYYHYLNGKVKKCSFGQTRKRHQYSMTTSWNTGRAPLGTEISYSLRQNSMNCTMDSSKPGDFLRRDQKDTGLKHNISFKKFDHKAMRKYSVGKILCLKGLDSVRNDCYGATQTCSK